MSGALPRSFDLQTISAGDFRLPAVLRGPPAAPVVLILQPLFEEMNRCRRFLADFGAALAGLGVASLLPDLPGEGDSEHRGASADAWDAAIGALPPAAAIVAMRGGCLVGRPHPNRFHIAATSGAAIFREMIRAQAFAELEATGVRSDHASYTRRLDAGETLRLSGSEVGADLYRSLAHRLPCAAASLDYAGAPIWRQADPRREAAEAASLAAVVAGRLGA